MSGIVGYGIDLSSGRTKWKKDVNNILIGIIKEKCPILRREYEDELDCNVPDNYDTEELFLQNGFVDEFVEGLSGTGGLEGLVLAAIKEISNDDTYSYDDVCIYYPAYIPANEKERALRPTQEDIEKILTEVVNPLMESPVKAEWLDIHLD